MNREHLLAESADELPLDRAIQRCADGELSDAAERSLFARLEFQPDGWRRLALSFVEGRVLGTVCRGEVAMASPSMAYTATPRTTRRGRVARPTALAAAALLAFGAGRWSSVATPAPSPSIAAVDSVQPPAGESPIAAESPRDEVPAPPPRAPVPAMFVNLDIPGSDAAVPVPIYEFAGATDWQPFDRHAIAPNEADQLRRAGYHVNTARHVFQITAPEGQSILLPMEMVKVSPARF